MLRAALYARFSTDDQSPTSCADQLALCRRFAQQHGAHVLREFSDDGISGFSTGNRPGVRGLLAAARDGEFDVVIAEHSDRLSRGLSGSGAVYEDLKSFGVRYMTVNQGVVTLAMAGLSGLVSAMTLEEGANKTRRGLQARVEAGRSGGGLTYGYRKVLAYDAAGEPVRGLLEVDEAQAAIVRRVFRDYAAGVSPQAIAHALNREGVAGPRGGPWNASTLHGNAARGTGVLHNELYTGVRVWGRRTFVKDRQTGARRGLDAGTPPIRREVPELRILAPALWDAARARYALVATGPQGEGVSGRRRPKRFLQGLVVCGLCDKAMHRSGPGQALRCSTRIEKGQCANGRTPAYPSVEARVIAAIKENLLHPDVIEHAIRTIQDGLREGRRTAARRQAKVAAEIAEVKRRKDRLIDQLEDGVPWAALKERHEALETRLAALEAEASAGPADAEGEILAFHPSAPRKYRQLVEDLAAALDDPQDPEGRDGREAVRALIQQVRLTPAEGHGQYALEIVGDLAPILRLGQNAEGPREGGLPFAQVRSQIKGGLGAGTRVTRRLNVSAPFRQVA